MRIRLLLALVGCLFVSGVTAHPLTAKNLRLVAARMTPNFDYSGLARSQMRLLDPLTWALLEDDPGAMQAALRLRAAALREDSENFDLEQPFVVGRIVRLGTHNEQLGGFAVGSAIPGSFHPVHNTPNHPDSPLPDAFTLLTPNFDQLKVWPAAPDARAPARVYVESQIRLLAFQQNQFFQAVVVKTAVYASKGKQRLLFEKREGRSPEQIVGESLLRDGITLDRVPIHSFYVFGERLLEPLNEAEMRDSQCEALPPRKGHLEWYCSADWPLAGIDVKIGRRYVGGRLVELEFFSRERPAAAALRKIRLQIIRDTSLPAESEPDSVVTWNMKATEFRFDPEALAEGSADKAFLAARPDAFFKAELKPAGT